MRNHRGRTKVTAITPFSATYDVANRMTAITLTAINQRVTQSTGIDMILRLH